MNCAEFHELAPAYALDALPEEERLAALRHLRDEGPHDGCEALVARYERAVDTLGLALPPVPVPPSLWRVIETRLGFSSLGSRAQGRASTRAGADVIALPQRGRLEPTTRWREGLAWATAAAALLGALWSHQTASHTAGSVAQEQRQRAQVEQSLAATSGQLAAAESARQECSRALAQLTRESTLGRDAVALLEQPDTKVTAMSPAGAQTYRATALYNAASKRAVVISTSMKPVPGKDYELWVIASGPGQAPQPAGFVRFDAGGVAIGELDATLLGRTPAAFAVSLEPVGGRPTPTEVVLLGKLEG
jgi:anti-sigma-K factor RskA